MTNVTNMIVMMSNQEPLTITTHFSPLFESNCTVLSPQVLCPGRAWGGIWEGMGGKEGTRRMVKKTSCRFLFPSPGAQLRGDDD